MQQLLSVCLRGLLPKGPRNTIMRLCSFFNRLCQRTIVVDKIVEMENEIVETLCALERWFPPSFFDIMIHLVVHIGREARLCGPVQFRWIYPFERYMMVLKGYVRNRARPEGCIAESYLADECVRFCSTFIKDTINVCNHEARNDSSSQGRPISARKLVSLNDEDLVNAHRYVLFNSPLVEPYLQ